MTKTQIPTAVGGTIAHADDERRAGFLDAVMARIEGCFRRCEPRRLVRDFVLGLLMELDDHNCWTLGEALGHTGPHRLQHLLSRAKWDERQVLDQTALWAAGHLTGPDGCGDVGGDAVFIVDETGDAKSSTDCVGAARQYSGSLGGVALCQVTVNLTLATPRGHTIIDRRLYLPRDWAADEERRELAGVPEQVEFATKPQLAAAMLTHACDRRIGAAFVAGDEVYGGRDLRRTVRGLGMGYVMAVKHDHTVTLGPHTTTARKAVRLIGDGGWQRMRTGTGTKGVRSYDWAMLAITPDDTPDRGQAGDRSGDQAGCAVLLVRRHRYTRKLSYYRCFSTRPVPLARLVAVATVRWKIEEDHQLAKQACGLDKGQTTCWRSWHRWTCLALLAYTYLAVTTATEHHPDDADDPELIPITVPELLRLIRGTVVPPPVRDPAHRHAWSLWRRRHQQRARTCHHAWHTYAETTP
ncbi:IS701 family transposase [Actinomadura latina]|uniref:IS701 family transposase n=1 Tax=Actinomadura latina TaxID=163603 RepID=A0A846ZE57_9ACTN|nr:IS701 family transposase [Actinomadura latina]NKZ09094.1 IS701 family transposase [Actinomadura latina]